MGVWCNLKTQCRGGVAVIKQHRQILDLSTGEQDFPQSPVKYQDRTHKKLLSVEPFRTHEGQEKALRCTWKWTLTRVILPLMYCSWMMTPSFHWFRGVSSCIRTTVPRATRSPDMFLFFCDECCSLRPVKYSLVSISWQSAVRKSFREQSARGFVLNIVQRNCSGNFFSSIWISRLPHESVWTPSVFKARILLSQLSWNFRNFCTSVRVRWFLKAIPYARWLELVFFPSVLSAFQWLFHSLVMSLVALKSRALRCWLSILSNSSFCQYCSVHDCCVLHYYNYPKT